MKSVFCAAIIFAFSVLCCCNNVQAADDASFTDCSIIKRGSSLEFSAQLSNYKESSAKIIFAAYDDNNAIKNIALKTVGSEVNIQMPYDYYSKVSVYLWSDMYSIRPCINKAFEFTDLKYLEEVEPYMPASGKEMIALCDQKNSQVIVCLQEGDWNNSSPVWTYKMPNNSLISDARLRWSEYHKKYVVLVTSSGLYSAIVEYPSGTVLWSTWGNNILNNPHAIEILPNGNVAIADSSGNKVFVFTSSQGKTSTAYASYTLTDAHGLSWDPDKKILWALGTGELYALNISGTASAPIITKDNARSINLPTVYSNEEPVRGHDLFPAYGNKDVLWISASYNMIGQFNKENCVLKVSTKTKLKGADGNAINIPGIDLYTVNNSDISKCIGYSIKSLSSQPFSNTIVKCQQSGVFQSWCTDTVNLYYTSGSSITSSLAKKHNTAAFYKARAWWYKYE